jgi:hypothetical protein
VPGQEPQHAQELIGCEARGPEQRAADLADLQPRAVAEDDLDQRQSGTRIPPAARSRAVRASAASSITTVGRAPIRPVYARYLAWAIFCATWSAGPSGAWRT